MQRSVAVRDRPCEKALGDGERKIRDAIRSGCDTRDREGGQREQRREQDVEVPARHRPQEVDCGLSVGGRLVEGEEFNKRGTLRGSGFHDARGWSSKITAQGEESVRGIRVPLHWAVRRCLSRAVSCK